MQIYVYICSYLHVHIHMCVCMSWHRRLGALPRRGGAQERHASLDAASGAAATVRSGLVRGPLVYRLGVLFLSSF